MNSKLNKQNREKINSGSQSACNYPRVYVQFPRLVWRAPKKERKNVESELHQKSVCEVKYSKHKEQDVNIHSFFVFLYLVVRWIKKYNGGEYNERSYYRSFKNMDIWWVWVIQLVKIFKSTDNTILEWGKTLTTHGWKGALVREDQFLERS